MGYDRWNKTNDPIPTERWRYNGLLVVNSVYALSYAENIQQRALVSQFMMGNRVRCNTGPRKYCLTLTVRGVKKVGDCSYRAPTGFSIWKLPFLKIPWHENVTFWGFLTLIRVPLAYLCSPSSLEIPLGVKRALGILLRLWKNDAQTRSFEIFPWCRHKRRCHLAFLCLASPENLARQWAPHACVIIHTVMQVLHTSLLFG